jgi:tetratricopeptide (TPR) repeat protein
MRVTRRIRPATGHTLQEEKLPRADPDRSFDAAVRHLFRHLDEPHQLRRNPLVKHLFHTVEGRPTWQSDKNAMRRVRILISDVVRRHVGASTSQDADSYRQWTIAAKCLLEGQRSGLIAAQLGISQRKVYYERAKVYREIAIYLQAQRPGKRDQTPVIDVLCFQFDRADAQAEAGDYAEAISSYNAILSANPGTQHCIESLCKRADVDADWGNFGQAVEGLNAAQHILNSCRNSIAKMAFAAFEGHISLLRSKAAWGAGDISTAASALDRAQMLVEPYQITGDRRLKELCLAILLERENRSELHGDLSAVTSSLRAALALASTIPDLSPKLDIDCTIAAAMEFLFCDRADYAQDAILNVRRLERALGIAKSSRLLSRIIEIELELNNPRLTLDRSGGVFREFEHIAAMARALKNPRVMDMMSTFLAKRILRGNQWQALPAFLTNGSTLTEGSWDWIERKLVESDYFAKTGDFATARDAAERARRAAQAIGNSRLTAEAMRGLASAFLALGFKEEALEQIEAAISIVERGAGTMEWRLTYQLAGKITGDVRYSRAIARSG